MNALSDTILGQGHETEEEEEVVSLSNSPILSQTAQPNQKFDSEPSELFEFFNDLSSSDNNNIMSHAEDIIFCGKLIPLKQSLVSDHKLNILDRVSTKTEKEEKVSIIQVKYATQPNSPKSSSKHMMRNSKSLDYQQLRRSLSSDCRATGIRRYSSTKCSVRYDCNSGQKVNKPRWYSMLFGLVSKTPPEMELRDIKNRLVRRTPSTMFTPFDSSKEFSTTTQSNRKSSWNFLSVLSCKDNASIGITASTLGFMPHVNGCDSAYSRATCT